MRIVKAGVVVLGLLTAVSWFGQSNLLFDTLSNFRAHFAAAFLACSLVMVAARQGRWLVLAGIGLAANLAPILPWYLPAAGQPVTTAAGSIKVLESNVYMPNTDYDRLERLIIEEQPDVLGLVEVSSRWLEHLPALRRDYTYRFEAPSDSYVGLALYSKLPLSDARIVYFGASATQAIVATLHMPDGEVELVLAHPPPPMDSPRAARRNAQLLEMAEHFRAATKPVLLIADLNATLWNVHYRQFAERSGLQNARAGSGIGPTWPAVPLLGIPIDHIMTKASAQLRNFRTLHGIGSDHLPISAEFSLRGRGNSRESAEAGKHQRNAGLDRSSRILLTGDASHHGFPAVSA